MHPPAGVCMPLRFPAEAIPVAVTRVVVGTVVVAATAGVAAGITNARLCPQGPLLPRAGRRRLAGS
jgi:hypothetical protein